jgi:type IV secretion system protein TrbF
VRYDPFRRSSVRYGETPSPVTPYQRASQVWDERLGSARAEAMNWRLAALGSIGLSVLLTVMLVVAGGHRSVTPYVVEVDRSGEVRTVGPAIDNYKPSDAQIEHFLARFIENVRALSIDPIVVRTNWLRAYDFVTDQGAEALNAYAREVNPFAKIGTTTIATEVTSVVRASSDSFEVRWKEATFENGTMTKSDYYTGVFTIVFKPPDTTENLRKNPLGLYIHSLNWSRDLIGAERK